MKKEIPCLMIRIADTNERESKELLRQLSDCLEKITGNSGAHSFDAKEIDNRNSIFVIATIDGNTAGCGACRKLDDTTVELKRIYAKEGRKGIGTSIVTFLEKYAKENQYSRVVLETRKVNEKAVAFYQRMGYQVIDNYGDYKGRNEAICFEKHLV